MLHTAAFWLMHGVRAAIPRANPLAKGKFATIRERLIKIGARVIEHIGASASAADVSPGGRVVPNRRPRPAAIRPVSRGAVCPKEPPTQADQSQTRCTVSGLTPDPVGRIANARRHQIDARKLSA
jgi:hypothetical protein